MQLYTIVRGEMTQVQRYLWGVSNTFLDWQMPGSPRVKMPIFARPIQLVEFAFPEEKLREALRAIQPYSYVPGLDNKAKWIQKMLRLKPMPSRAHITLAPYKQCVDVLGIGLRQDSKRKDGSEVL